MRVVVRTPLSDILPFVCEQRSVRLASVPKPSQSFRTSELCPPLEGCPRASPRRVIHRIFGLCTPFP